ncbi:MAG: hypothetical protein KJN93_10750, partial [Alphaproteobacteria bacterium]|nr:hypothetical protein [Alphaproteobacteria bacterium]
QPMETLPVGLLADAIDTAVRSPSFSVSVPPANPRPSQPKAVTTSQPKAQAKARGPDKHKGGMTIRVQARPWVRRLIARWRKPA